LGILGLGNIGNAVAFHAKQFGMTAIGLVSQRRIDQLKSKDGALLKSKKGATDTKYNDETKRRGANKAASNEIIKWINGKRFEFAHDEDWLLASSLDGKGVTSRTTQTEEEGAYVLTSSLSAVLRNSDSIVNLLPSTETTRGLLDRKMSGGRDAGESFSPLAICAKRKPLFINVGRGDLVSPETILTALKNEWITAAILDVFATEPLPATSPLWSHPQIIITPHVAAESTANDVVGVFLHNLERYLFGNGRQIKEHDDKEEVVRKWERDLNALDFKIDARRGY